LRMKQAHAAGQQQQTGKSDKKNTVIHGNRLKDHRA
jgi:hypothetical protein